MKLYLTTGALTKPRPQLKVVWTGTQAQALKAKAELEKAGFGAIVVTEEDIPLDKNSLIKWLNEKQAFIEN